MAAGNADVTATSQSSGRNRSLAQVATPPAPATVPAQLMVPTPKREGPPSLFDDGQSVVTPENQALIDLRIVVPHKDHAVDVFNLYPYPPKPPAATHSMVLPVHAQDVKGLLLSAGYSSRPNPDRPFQTGGWRFMYALHRAEEKSGLGVPHSIFTEYQWVHAITPYMIKETRRWNDIEDQRWARYKKAEEDYDKHHEDAEAEATRQGLNAMELKKRGFGWAKQVIPPGSWWMTCTRKVPGLTYYWQIPLTAAPGEKVKILLSEMNALVIEGAW